MLFLIRRWIENYLFRWRHILLRNLLLIESWWWHLRGLALVVSPLWGSWTLDKLTTANSDLLCSNLLLLHLLYSKLCLIASCLIVTLLRMWKLRLRWNRSSIRLLKSSLHRHSHILLLSLLLASHLCYHLLNCLKMHRVSRWWDLA